MNNIITLTTDFGLSDAYVASVKGVILNINPQAVIVDICNTVKPQNIGEAAFILGTAHKYFPEGTIHLAVVDPGVGTKRRAVVLKTPAGSFVAPDNGLLSYIFDDFKARPLAAGTVKTNHNLAAFSITNSKFWRKPVSSTFHGRDIFGPVAAYLSLGTPAGEFGRPLKTLKVLPSARPKPTSGGHLIGSVIHIDNFGNLVANIKKSDLPHGKTISISIAGKQIRGLSYTYAEAEDLLALIGSTGYVEVSLKNGSAAGFLGVGTGDKVNISQT
jgi:S-adenosyl-L-methionine hydrolase (adenosine-forming)